MSWLGEQFSSFTEKISDFTKEVLIDDVGSGKLGASNQNGSLSYEELLNLCKDKDQRIEILISEKASLENSIEELDEQHQEAVDALLLQKNQVVAENNALKERLSHQENQLCENQSIDYSPIFTTSNTSSDAKLNPSETLCTELVGEDINLISLLQSVSDCSEDEKFKKQIHWLEMQKNSITAPDQSECLNRIDNYINFLDALHSQSLYSIVDEICSIFNTLESDNNQLRQKYKSGADDLKQANLCDSCDNRISRQSDDHGATHSKSTTSASEEVSLNGLLKTTPISSSRNVDSSQGDVSYQTSSKLTQTDNSEPAVIEEEVVVNQLKSDIQALEQQNKQYQQKICNLQTLLNKTFSTVSTETDNYDLKKLQLELTTAQNTIRDQELAYDELLKKHAKDLKDSLQSNISMIAQRESQIQSMEIQMNSLQETINDLKLALKMSEKNNRSHIGEENHIDKQSTHQKFENEINSLQEKSKMLELEKGKLLCVLSEKSQECSSLKAEVHKLTSIVASEKQALFKLQQDNCDLKNSTADKPDPELSKETIKKLSTLIKDKDLEIESLEQKNSTLTTLIQNVSSVPDQLQSLMDEKETLSKQVHRYEVERDKIMASYNVKDKDWRECTAEVKKLSNLLSEHRTKFDILEQSHLSVAQQYEEKQKALINAQSEMVSLKQHVNELEQQLVDVKEKHSDLLNKLNSDATIQITKEELYEKDTKVEKLTCGNVEKDHLIQEKDCMIHDLSQQSKKLKAESEQQAQVTLDLHEKLSNLTDRYKNADDTIEQLQQDKVLFEQRFQDKSSELDLLKEMNERLNMAVKEKEFAVQSMTEKISSLSQYITSGPSTSGTADVNQILADSESMFSEAQKSRRERDETILALNLSKQENQSLRNEIQRMKSNEIHLENQLSRLRQHLVEVEEHYTNEAIKSEEKEKGLKDELVEVKRRADITSTAVVDTNQRASIQIASLQEQLSIVANQRDEALAQASSLEDKVLQHSTSVNKLQLVLEQMQKGNERKIKEIDNKWHSQLQKQNETVMQLEKQLQIKQMQLEESSKALEAASRLSEQLDAKEEVIICLKSELSKTENKIKSTAQEINSIKSNTEGKVDRVVMKSLVLGYFSTPPGQKSEVIRLLARVLDFNQEEMEKAGIVVGRQVVKQESRGLFSSIFSRLPSMSTSEQSVQQPQKSFTTLFVQFLENESQPIVRMPFPAEKMAQELTLKTHPNKKNQSASNNSSPRRSPLLMDIDSAFPTFTPLPAVEYSTAPAPAILKEVLE